MYYQAFWFQKKLSLTCNNEVHEHLLETIINKQEYMENEIFFPVNVLKEY